MTEKILKIVQIALFVISLGILGLFIFGGDVPDQTYPTPVYTGAMLNWGYLLLGLAAISALVFPIVRLVTRPKQALKSLVGVVALGVVIFIAYTLSDGTPMKIIGYDGPDNVYGSLIMTDTIIYSMYILLGGAVLSIIATGIIKRFR